MARSLDHVQPGSLEIWRPQLSGTTPRGQQISPVPTHLSRYSKNCRFRETTESKAGQNCKTVSRPRSVGSDHAGSPDAASSITANRVFWVQLRLACWRPCLVSDAGAESGHTRLVSTFSHRPNAGIFPPGTRYLQLVEKSGVMQSGEREDK